MLTVWGRPSSINVQKVMWMILHLSLQHERHDAGGRFGGRVRISVVSIRTGGYRYWSMVTSPFSRATQSFAILRHATTKVAFGQRIRGCARGPICGWIGSPLL